MERKGMTLVVVVVIVDEEKGKWCDSKSEKAETFWGESSKIAIVMTMRDKNLIAVFVVAVCFFFILLDMLLLLLLLL